MRNEKKKNKLQEESRDKDTLTCPFLRLLDSLSPHQTRQEMNPELLHGAIQSDCRSLLIFEVMAAIPKYGRCIKDL
jgi:hypothetical protein